MSSSVRRWWPVALAGLVLLFLFAAGWLFRDRFAPVEVGSRAPNFTAVDLQGSSVSLSDLGGEVVFLNVWATWCPPCREEMPSMQRLYERLGPEGLRIVAVSIDAVQGKADPTGRAGGDVQAFAEEYGLTFDIWHDPSGEIQRIYRTTGVPESFVIDRAGIIVKKVIGATDWDSEANIELFRRLLRVGQAGQLEPRRDRPRDAGTALPERRSGGAQLPRTDHSALVRPDVLRFASSSIRPKPWSG